MRRGPHACEELIYAVDEVTVPIRHEVMAGDRFFGIEFLDSTAVIEPIHYCPFDGATLMKDVGRVAMPFGRAEPHRGPRPGKVVDPFFARTRPASRPVHLCGELQDGLADDTLPLDYEGVLRELRLAYVTPGAPYPNPDDDGKGPRHVLAHCPFCGDRLPASLRDEWFRRIEAMGLEPDDPRVPESMQSDRWWRDERL